MKMNLLTMLGVPLLGATFLASCSGDKKDSGAVDLMGVPKSSDAIESVTIDRFSDEAGHLMRRSASPSLPAAGEAINFDAAPFITAGFGPSGDQVSYYNFDVQSVDAAPIYVFFKEGSASPVEGQSNVVDVVPGQLGYSDFWNVVKVTVPASYVANSVTSFAGIVQNGYVTSATNIVVNCPIVPAGSVASHRYNNGNDVGLHVGWYREKSIAYFNFSEKRLTLTGAGKVPVSPIFVTFNKNPDAQDPTSGPSSGFRIDATTGRTHNVTQTVPEDADYSPLWSVAVYDNLGFSSVHDLASVAASNVLARGVANVNCPIVLRSAVPSPPPTATPSATDGSLGLVTLVQTAAGQILADASGLALYTFDNDITTTSTCYGSCAIAWPPLIAAAAVLVPYSLAARTDGAQQISYKNRPLYRYVGDGAPGDINGEGLGGIWHLAKP